MSSHGKEEEDAEVEGVENDLEEERARIKDMKLFPEDKQHKHSDAAMEVDLEGDDKEVDKETMKRLLVERMKELPFDPSTKSPQYGLPVRLKWQLWAEIVEVKLSKELREQSPHWDLYVKVEVGADAHFHVLESSIKEQTTAASWWGGEGGEVPRDRFEIYHLRKEKCKVSVWYRSSVPGMGDTCIGYCMYPLKKLKPLTPQYGWVKVKAPGRSKDDREAKAMVRVGFMISHSINAGYLFLIDSKAGQVLFYQKVETIDDLNPVFSKHSMKPFSYKGSFGSARIAVRDSNKKEVFVVSPTPGAPSKAVIMGANDKAFLSSVEMVMLSDETLVWNCDGSFEGAVVQASTVPYHRYVILAKTKYPAVALVRNNVNADATAAHDKEVALSDKYPGYTQVAEAQWRNARDMKLAVLTSTVDCAVIISAVLAVRVIQTVQYANS